MSRHLPAAFVSVMALAAVLSMALTSAASARQPRQTPRACPLPVHRFSMQSGSMLPTMRIGEIVVIQCWPQAVSGSTTDPSSVELADLRPAVERGDVIAFLNGPKRDVWVKRVVGLPRDRVQMVNGRLVLNGETVEIAPAASGGAKSGGRRYVETLPGGARCSVLKETEAGEVNNTPDYVVPPDSLFVLGDNRDSSLDSRMMDLLGFVKVRDLVGRIARYGL